MHMRTTLDIPEELIKEAMKILGVKTKSDAIKGSLEKLIKSYKRKQLIGYKGKIDLDINLNELRNRG